jgi:hypothetical protein
MPQVTYALQPNEPKRLEVRWGANFRDTEVKLDGRVLATLATRAELQQGRDIPLPDGSMLNVRLGGTWLMGVIHVTRDGKPLQVSASDPATLLRTATFALYFVAGLNVLAGLAAVATRSPLLTSLGMGWSSVVFGLIFLGLALWARTGSVAALAIAAVLLAVDFIAGLGLSMAAGASPALSGICLRAALIWFVLQGIPGARALEAQRRQEEPS